LQPLPWMWTMARLMLSPCCNESGKAKERAIKSCEKQSDERETWRWKAVFVGFSQSPFCLYVAN